LFSRRARDGCSLTKLLQYRIKGVGSLLRIKKCHGMAAQLGM
jgi:hypothetical protein